MKYLYLFFIAACIAIASSASEAVVTGGGAEQILSNEEISRLADIFFSASPDEKDRNAMQKWKQDAGTAGERLRDYFEAGDKRCAQLSMLLPQVLKTDDMKGEFGSPLQLYIGMIPKSQDRNFTPFMDIIGSCLQNIDYTIDGSTMPMGINVTADAFYPCARALVKLRVQRFEVLSRIEDCDQAVEELADNASQEEKDARYARRLQLLTWVLYQIEQKDAELVQFLLEREIKRGKDENGNFARALKFVDVNVKNTGVRLPRAHLKK